MNEPLEFQDYYYCATCRDWHKLGKHRGEPDSMSSMEDLIDVADKHNKKLLNKKFFDMTPIERFFLKNVPHVLRENFFLRTRIARIRGILFRVFTGEVLSDEDKEVLNEYGFFPGRQVVRVPESGSDVSPRWEEGDPS